MNVNRSEIKNTNLSVTLPQNVEVYDDNLINHTVTLIRFAITTNIKQPSNALAIYFQKSKPSIYYV
jgi:hypothetical protein